MRRIRLPKSLTDIRLCAFRNCEHLTEFDAPVELQAIGNYAFDGCSRLVRIGIPLNDQMIHLWIQSLRATVPVAVEHVGDIHETVSLLGLTQWQQDVKEGIGLINQILTPSRNKTVEIHHG